MAKNTFVNPTESAIVRRQQAAATSPLVVTGVNSRPSHSTTLYCETEAEATALIDLLFRCGFETASWAPNHHRAA